MKIKLAILAAALTAGTAFATTEPAPAVDFSTLPALSAERLTGSLTAGAATNYTGKGYVVSRTVAGGEGIGFAAVKMNYDLGKKKDYWSIDFTMAYKAPVSGHTLYGNPSITNAAFLAATKKDFHGSVAAAQYYINQNKPKIGARNIENEFAVITAAKYKREKWNFSMGHQFVHGGLYGVMAKHFRHQGASCTNEAFLAPEWTPTAWFAAGVKASYSFQGIHGWWYEPYVTFKAPLVGTENGIISNSSKDLKLAAVLTFAMSATSDYYNEGDFACSNGSQAFWMQLSTPWFVRENIIITPSVSFNWLGKGGMKANEQSHVKQATNDSSMVPFKNFGVVGTLSATYTF